MLFSLPGYFVWLVAFVSFYWLACRQPPARLAFLAATGLATSAYLLYRNLPGAIAIPLLGALLLLSVASFALARRQLQKRSIALLRLGLALPFAVYGLAHGHALYSRLPADLTVVIPISIGFFVLRQLHLVYECYRGNIKTLDLTAWAAYVFFMPTLIAGPLARQPQFLQAVGTPFSADHLRHGVELLLIGAFKKFVLADLLMSALLPPSTWAQAGFPDASWTALALACLTKFLYVYFDFSGYTDMARGTARLIGIELPENFNQPLLKANLAEFWRSWHMSLASFARDYVYFPTLVRTRRPALAIAATMLVIASWHGVQPGWLLWGLHHAIGLIVLATLQRRAVRWSKLGAVRGHTIWRHTANGLTIGYVSLAYAWTWQPDAPMAGLSIWWRLLSGGLLA